MTRETKIGLLVGLAFIIVIGILLSDHMTSTNEPALAPLQVAGANVRSGVGQPASDNAPPLVVIPPANVTPVQPVPTREELNPPRSSAPITAIGQQNSPPQNPVSPMLSDAAKRAGEELVDVDGHPVANTDFPPTPVAPKSPASYTAVSGDSLTKIATKVYGTSTRANRQAIAEANPSLRENPNRIVAGKTYVIPPLGGAPAPSVVNSTAVATAVDKPVDDSKYSYTVKSGDTLWSIARDQMGDTKTVAAIKDLNKDILRGSDCVRPNMKLRLPAKPVTT
jgi:nucleoid-associated protein YgaU